MITYHILNPLIKNQILDPPPTYISTPGSYYKPLTNQISENEKKSTDTICLNCTVDHCCFLHIYALDDIDQLTD